MKSDHPRFSRPRSAYVHVPFCRHHCGYCNFSVIAGRDDLVDAYLRAVDLETSKLEGPHAVDTLYVGGGTPTHLAPTQLARLLRLLRDRFELAEQGEISIEANPEDLVPEYSAVFADAGVTRVSLGAQSFNHDKLARLDRCHGSHDVDRAMEVIRSAGADVAIDLIFAAPEERLDEWQADLEEATARTPDHVSCYGLTYEAGTQFLGRLRKGALKEVDEEAQRQQYEAAIDTLQAAGFEHYEISNFARSHKRSRHNQVYWRGQPFFGIGPGAARFVGGCRSLNHRSTTSYIKRVLAGQDPTTESDVVDAEGYARERLVFGLRMLEGIDQHLFEDETGFTLENLADEAIATFVQQRLLAWSDSRLQLTRDGLLVSDAIWPNLI